MIQTMKIQDALALSGPAAEASQITELQKLNTNIHEMFERRERYGRKPLVLTLFAFAPTTQLII